jgi:hypothetical protein
MPYPSGADWKVEIVAEGAGETTVELVSGEVTVIPSRAGLYLFEDFLSAPRFTSFVVPVFNNTDEGNYVNVNNGDIARCLYRVTRSAKLIGVAIFAEDTLASNNTNYVTFTLTNKVGGTQSVVMLAATDANTTKATGGSALTAYVTRTLTLSSTTLDLAVNAGDVLLFEVTTTGTLANVVDTFSVRLQFEELPESVAPLGQRGTRSVLYDPVTTANGGAYTVQLPAPAESLAGRIDGGGRLQYNADKSPVFRCRAKVSAVAANQDFFFGFSGAAAGIPYDNTLINAWFRLSGNSLDLLAEVDNNAGNDDDDNPVGVTLVADTYYIFKVDLTDLAAVAFTVYDETGEQLGEALELSLAGIAANTLIQPVCAITKTAGAQTDSFTLDWLEVYQPTR